MKRTFTILVALCFCAFLNKAIGQTFTVLVNGSQVGTYNSCFEAVYMSSLTENTVSQVKNDNGTTIYEQNVNNPKYWMFQLNPYPEFSSFIESDASSFLYTYENSIVFKGDGTVYGARTDGKNNMHKYIDGLESGYSYVYKFFDWRGNELKSMTATLDLSQCEIAQPGYYQQYPAQNLYLYGNLSWGIGGWEHFEWGFMKGPGDNEWWFFDNNGKRLDKPTKPLKSILNLEWKLDDVNAKFSFLVDGNEYHYIYLSEVGTDVNWIRSTDPKFLMATTMVADYTGGVKNKITNFRDGTFVGPVKWKDCKIHFTNNDWVNFWQSDSQQSIYCNQQTVKVLQPNSSQNPTNSEIITLSRNGSFETTSNITTSSNPYDGGTTSGGGTKTVGTTCTVTAQANNGYSFIKWSENELDVSTNQNYTFTVSGTRNLVANFVQQQQYYTISTSSNPSTGGSTNGGGTYTAGSSHTVQANANSGYEFINWKENSSVVSTNLNYTFNVTNDRNLFANFTQTSNESTWNIGHPNYSSNVIATLSDNTLTISGSGNMVDFWCSSEGEAPWWFDNANRLAIKTVVIENGVQNIGMRAFKDLINLESVTIPPSVNNINGQAFYNCSSLNNVNIENGNANLEFRGYRSSNPCGTTGTINTYDWFSGTSIVTLHLGRNYTGDFISNIRGSLTNLTIGNKVSRIGSNAFSNCNSLLYVIIENGSPTPILLFEGTTNHPFVGCANIESVHLGRDVSYSETASNRSPFSGKIRMENLTIGEEVTRIGNYLFDGCSSLNSMVTFHNKVELIGVASFRGCGQLSNIKIKEHIENKVQTIGSSAFQNSGITAISIPKTVNSIGQNAFAGCNSLLNVTIEDGDPTPILQLLGTTDHPFSGTECANIQTVHLGRDISYSETAINRAPFSGKTRLTTLTIGNEVTRIGNYLFYGCSSLNSIVTIPNKIVYIGNYAFWGCGQLSTVNTTEHIENKVQTIGSNAFQNSGITSISIPKTVNSIGQNAFAGCNSLLYVTIEDGEPTPELQLLGTTDHPFSGTGCVNIQKVHLGRNLSYSETVSNRAPFSGKTRLTNLTMGNSVTKIGAFLFDGCSALDSPITFPNKIEVIGNYSFRGCGVLKNVYIPEHIEGKVQTIGSNSFQNCGLIAISIPKTVNSIGQNSFAGCNSLLYVTIEDGEPTPSLTLSGTSADLPFSACANIQALHLGRNLSYVYNTSTYLSPFSGKTKLSSLTIGDDVTRIGACLFYNCSSLTSITIPNSVDEIGNRTFANCTNLETVIIEDSQATLTFGNTGNIGYYFDKCPIKTLYIGRFVWYWYITGNYSSGPFSGKTSLTTLTIGNDVNEIATLIFYGCTGLAEIISYPTTPPDIQTNSFYGVKRDIPIFIDCNYLTNYQTSPIWSEFTDYQCLGGLKLLSLTVNGELYQNQTGSFTVTLKNYGDEDYNSRLWIYMEKPEIYTPNQQIGSEDIFYFAAGETKTINFTGTITLPPDVYDVNMIYDANNNPYDMDLLQFHNILGVKAIVHQNSVFTPLNIGGDCTIHPNPTKDNLFITSDFKINKVEIYSLTGALLLIENNFNEKISVSHLSSGVYFVVVESNTGEKVVNKMVKK